MYGEAPKGEALIAQTKARRDGEYVFKLYPELWTLPLIGEYYNHRVWTITKFIDPPEIFLPEDSGIYMFVVAPYSGNLKDHSYIFLIGKTDNLRRRYREYLQEQKGLGTHPRDKVVRFLDHLKNHVYFHFTLIPEPEITEAEKLLVDNLTPQANTIENILGRLETGEIL